MPTTDYVHGVRVTAGHRRRAVASGDRLHPIKLHRHRLGLSIAALADAARVSPSTVVRAEAGARVSEGTLALLATALGATVEELRDGG